MRRLAGLPLRLLIAQRSDMPGGPPPFGLADAARPIPIERLWLEPLSMGALHQLLRSATDSSFTRPTLLRIQELSGGNPFYALELARAFVASGTAARPGQNLPMPSSLRVWSGPSGPRPSSDAKTPAHGGVEREADDGPFGGDEWTWDSDAT